MDSVHKTTEPQEAAPGDEGSSVDEAPSSSVDPPSPSEPAAPGTAPAAPKPAASVVEPVEDVMMKDAAPKAMQPSGDSVVRQRGPTVTRCVNLIPDAICIVYIA